MRRSLRDDRGAQRSARRPTSACCVPDDPHATPSASPRSRHACCGCRELQAGRVAEADAAPGDQPAARRHLPGRRPPRRLPEERRGAGRAARAAPRRRARRPVHGAEDDERPRRAEGRRAPGPQRAHQPRRHRRQADGRRCSTCCWTRRPTPPSGRGWRRSGTSCSTPDGPDSPLRAAIDAGGYDVLRLLDEFPSCSLNIFEFLQVAQPLRPRYYSTSSSPRIHGDGVAHLTVGLEAAAVPGVPDRDFRGTSSHYLHALRDGRPPERLPRQRRRVPPAGRRDASR